MHVNLDMHPAVLQYLTAGDSAERFARLMWRLSFSQNASQLLAQFRNPASCSEQPRPHVLSQLHRVVAKGAINVTCPSVGPIFTIRNNCLPCPIGHPIKGSQRFCL